MNKRLVSLLKMVALSLGLVLFAVIINKKEATDSIGATSYDFAMGTSVSVSVYSDKKNADDVAYRLQKEVKKLDEEVISWRAKESELAQLNNNYKVDEIYEISQELFVPLSESLEICKYTQGALDITIRPLANLWNIEGEETFIPPSDEEIKIALGKVGYDNVRIVDEAYSDSNQDLEGNHYLVIDSDDVIIDLGATGKGYALDIARDILEEEGVDGALVTVGGSVLVYGAKSDNTCWKIGVRDPKEGKRQDEMIGYLEFPPGSTTCVSTSGGYEKYKTYDGRNYHHILDSFTGYPSNSELLSVTVVCDNGLVSDGLSTACFVLGYEKSLSILDKYNAQAVFIDKNNNITVTDGIRDNWKLD